jgi:tetratricopeptide (TPR) repeat protein
MRTWRHCVAVFLLVGLAAAPASADEASANAAPDLFARGVELADRGDYQAALQAFSDAYAARPNFAVLYNIGQAQVALGRPQEAAATLSRYLREGGDSVPADRRQQVQDQIKLIESFLVEIDLATDPAGATISIDNREVGRTPIPEPVRLTAGTHKITAKLDQATPEQPPSATPVHPKAAECPADKAGVALQAQSPPAPPPRRSGARAALPYLLAGAGLALGASALGVYLWKRADYQQWQDGEAALRNETPGSAAYQARAAENQRMADSLTTANHTILGLSVAGGVLVAAGVSLYLFDRASARNSASFAVAWSGGRSVAAGWRCSW